MSAAPEERAATGKRPEGPIGAVLVVGGGIGGMQASLDLAEAGMKVYLAEESSAIGGRMSQLDKTFPTNDCSMCIVSPKLVQVGRHPDIDVLSLTGVVGVWGEAGSFTVKLREESRYVDVAKCTGCGECEKVCPVQLPSEQNLGLNQRHAIFKQYPQAVPGAYAIEKTGTAPCRDACPAGVSACGYVALIAEGRYQEAVNLVRERNPFPGICGRVCTRPCEAACNRAKVDSPLAIRDLKRFISDWELANGGIKLPEPKPRKGQKVAIVGAGPGGLSAAYYLALEGYEVKVFEALPEPGGMMLVGIPEYRLPREILSAEIDAIRGLGVGIECGVRVGASERYTVRNLMDFHNYAAVLLATGAHQDLKLGIEGEDLDGVLPALELLRGQGLQDDVSIGKRVAVIGGGNSAFDAVRTALRRGAERVTIVYRRTRTEMPADEEEIDEALEEGVEIKFLAAPVRAIGDAGGKLIGVECLEMELGEPDASGRRRPVPKPGSEFVLDIDTLVPAIGQAQDPELLGPGEQVLVTPRGRLEADRTTCLTSVAGVFACGDAVTGPASVIEAVAAGREAAISIDRFLDHVPVGEGRHDKPAVAPVPELDGISKAERARPAELPAKERARTWDEVRGALTEEQARAEAARCLDCGVCSECFRCVDACEAKAIDHAMQSREYEVEVGSIVLAPGYELFDPELVGEYGYGRWPNVVSHLQFERLLSATGPTAGDLRRPSDDGHIKRVAWIQCVGSRDERKKQGYCSAVCCMAAAKQATVAREHHSDLQASIFFIDQRAQGKGFDAYVERTAEHYGVNFTRCLISSVEEMPETGDLRVQYVDPDGTVHGEEFDLVVLSAGIRPSQRVKDLARRLGLDLDRYGFCQTKRFEPMSTSRAGVFVCGAFEGPKDIPDTVAQASGSAAFASASLAPARFSETTVVEYPDEREVGAEDEPRIGVFVCRCGINIASVVDVPAVKEYARTLPNVVFAEEALFTCSEDTQAKMKQWIDEHRLNRVVVASCSPRTHEALFRLTLRESGLNQYLFDMANIRDQCSWVHQGEPERATAKAKDLVRSTVARSRMLRPLYEQSLPLTKRALVIGGGLAGMIAARMLSRQGFPVTLVERETELGGNLRRLRRSLDGEDVQGRLEALRAQLMGDENVQVLLGAEVVSSTGFIGNFETEVMVGAGPRKIRHGVTILATGGQQSEPQGYLYGEDERVVTQLDFEAALHDGAPPPRRVAMIQCVGSRCDERPYCSKVCCGQAVKNALELLRREPEASVFVLYRDVRTYGLAETLYAEARRAGVRFLRYDEDAIPAVSAREGGLEVKVADPVAGEVTFEVDRVVLAAAIEPTDVEELANLMKLPRNADGFLIEAHQKLRPVDMATEGVFLCGLAHGPKPLDETIAQAAGAAARAATVLARDEIRSAGAISVVDPDKCAVCLTCVRACPYGVPYVGDEGTAVIEAARCQGCGVCVAECPGLAIELRHYTEDQILAQCRAVLEPEVADAGL